MTYVEDHNPKQKKEKCIFFLESTNSEICSAVKKNILETRKRIVESSKTEFLNYKN